MSRVSMGIACAYQRHSWSSLALVFSSQSTAGHMSLNLIIASCLPICSGMQQVLSCNVR